jgi:hypothetical protein
VKSSGKRFLRMAVHMTNSKSYKHEQTRKVAEF